MREAASHFGVSSRVHGTGSDGRTLRATMIDRTAVASRKRRGLAARRSLVVFFAVTIVIVGAVAVVTTQRSVLQWPAHTATQNVIAGIKLSYQCSDNPGGFICQGCAAGGMVWHNGIPVMWDDVKYGGMPVPWPGDNIYGPGPGNDDCPHCSVYSGPACIQMVAAYRSGMVTPQDVIYDWCELDRAVGELQNNGQCERHGFGVLDGTGAMPPEIQTGLMVFVPGGVFQHNQWDASALTPATLEFYIQGMFPVIWSDHNGWPSNMDPRFPNPLEAQLQGHYKVIAGYDDGNTKGNPQDDFVLVFDPWPGYNDLGAANPTPLPVNALPGPGGPLQPDPYWQPVLAVLADMGDLFLVEAAAIPEFSGLLIPIVGMTIIAIVAFRVRTGGREP